MEIAILVFFLAIFGGILFLLALVWFIFRRIRNSRSARRDFSSGSSQGAQNYSSDDADNFYTNSAGAIYADNLMLNRQSDENSAPVVNQSDESFASNATAHDSPHQNESAHYSHESYGTSAAPADTSYSDSSYSGSDSGSSYDSGSSSDSSSGSSDSGGSGWSSD